MFDRTERLRSEDSDRGKIIIAASCTVQARRSFFLLLKMNPKPQLRSLMVEQTHKDRGSISFYATRTCTATRPHTNTHTHTRRAFFSSDGMNQNVKQSVTWESQLEGLTSNAKMSLHHMKRRWRVCVRVRISVCERLSRGCTGEKNKRRAVQGSAIPSSAWQAEPEATHTHTNTNTQKQYKSRVTDISSSLLSQGAQRV